MKRLHAIVDGRVQGVGYRDFVRRHAAQLGVTGWVRNRADGTVEVLAEGDDVEITHLLRLLTDGPSLSHVDAVETAYDAPTGEFPDFRVRH